jgi:hypothetical protein
MTDFTHAKSAMLGALRTQGIATVEIDYDGEGDSGQMGDIYAYDAERQSLPINKPVNIAFAPDEEPRHYDSLSEALDDFAWRLLQDRHGGFENNDGGYGTIVIDVPNCSVVIDHNDRFTDAFNTRTEV